MPKAITRALTLIAAAAVLVIAGAIVWPHLLPKGGQRPKVAHSVPQSQYKPVVGRHGGRIVLATLGAPASFNPVTSGEMSTTEYTQYMYLGLTMSDAWDFEVQPSLALSWTPDESGLVWIVKLRPGVLWSDGEPFTADDVVFTFETIYDKRVMTSARYELTGPKGEQWKVEKLDDLTLRFTLYDRSAIFPQQVGQSIIPKHKFESIVKAGKFNEAMGTTAKPEDMPVTGPFMFGGYDGSRVILRRNPHFYKLDNAGNRLPYLDEMVFLIVPDLDVQALKFLQGETDVAFMLGKDFPNLVKPAKQADFTVYMLGPNWGESFLTFNQNMGTNPLTKQPYVEPYKLKWFRDTRFRQAIAHAIDRQFMADGILNGLAYPQYGPMTLHSEAPMAFVDVPKFAYDLDKAKALLKEMGLVDRDGDGVLEDGEGHPVEFSFTTNAENEVRVKIAAIIRQDLEKLGVRVNFRAMSFNTLITKLDATFDWEACLLALTGSPEPHFGSNVWKSAGRTHEWFPLQKTPSTKWEAELNEIFDAGVRELDPVKRREIYARWQIIAAEQQPLIYTVTGEALCAMRNRFGNVFASKSSFPEPQNAILHNVEELFVLPPGTMWTGHNVAEKIGSEK
jgi:peptide/nickel transport system substrate-binding protein